MLTIFAAKGQALVFQPQMFSGNVAQQFFHAGNAFGHFEHAAVAELDHSITLRCLVDRCGGCRVGHMPTNLLIDRDDLK